MKLIHINPLPVVFGDQRRTNETSGERVGWLVTHVDCLTDAVIDVTLTLLKCETERPAAVERRPFETRIPRCVEAERPTLTGTDGSERENTVDGDQDLVVATGY